LAEVYALLADSGNKVKEALDANEFVSAVSCGGQNVQEEINDLRRQFASLQSAVDGDVLDAFRRLRQQATDTATKVDNLMSGHTSQFSVLSTSIPIVAADLEALESRLSASLREVAASLRERVEKIRLEMSPPVDEQVLEERLSAVLLARVEEIGRGLRELSVTVLGAQCEASSQSKKEREIAKASNFIEAKADEDLTLLQELEASARASCAEAKAWSECAHQGVEKVAAAMKQSEESDLLRVLDTRMSEVGQDLLLLMEERFAAVEMQIHNESKENARNCSTVREEIIEMTGLLFKTLEDRITSLNVYKCSGESCKTNSPGQKSLNSGSRSPQARHKSPKEKEAAGDFAREALVALRDRTTRAEDAVIAAIAAARAAASPESNRSVVSTFSPLAGLDPVHGYPKFGSMSPSQIDDSREGQALVLTALSEPACDSVQGNRERQREPQGFQECSSPQRLRGRQLPGRPEPHDFPELPVHDSPFRRKRHTRDLLPQFGSATQSFASLAPSAALQSLKEESATEYGSRDNSASAPSSAKTGVGTRCRTPTQSPSRSPNPSAIPMEKRRTFSNSGASPQGRNEKTQNTRSDKRSNSPVAKSGTYK